MGRYEVRGGHGNPTALVEWLTRPNGDEMSSGGFWCRWPRPEWWRSPSSTIRTCRSSRGEAKGEAGRRGRAVQDIKADPKSLIDNVDPEIWSIGRMSSRAHKLN